jgi:excisionase family DNA binding protein
MPPATVTDLSTLPTVLTMREVIAVLGVCRQHAFALVRQPGFPAKKFGNQWRVSRDGLMRWLEGHDVMAGSDDAA